MSEAQPPPDRKARRRVGAALVVSLLIAACGTVLFTVLPRDSQAVLEPPGSVAVGSAAYAAPAGALFVSPSGNDQATGTVSAPLRTVTAAINKAAAGKTIVLRAGTYHEAITIPAAKTGLSIQAYPREAVWFDGTSTVTGWAQQGNLYVRSNWTALFSHNASFVRGQYPNGQSPFVGSQNPMAAWPDAVWIDNVQQRQVASKGQVVPGTFFVDYTAKQLILGTNPTGHTVRASDLQQAIVSLAPSVKLQGFGVRRYATTLDQLGAVRIQGSATSLRDIVITQNATQGLSIIAAKALLERITATDNGMTGIHGNNSDNIVIRNCLIQGNNAQQFNPSPSAAGIKITRTRGVTVEDSEFTDNNSKGLWFDESVVGFNVTDNRLTNNLINADFELSDTGIFANNASIGSKYALYIYNTGNVQVYNNSFATYTVGGVFMSQDHRRQANPDDPGHDPRYPAGDPTNPWLTRNITVANNTFGASQGLFQVYALDKETKIPADKMNLTIDGNQFAPTPTMVGWGGSDNVTVTKYTTPAALATAKNTTWRNAQVNPATTSPTTAGNAVAIPLPATIATTIGATTATKQVGPYPSGGQNPGPQIVTAAIRSAISGSSAVVATGSKRPCTRR